MGFRLRSSTDECKGRWNYKDGHAAAMRLFDKLLWTLVEVELGLQ